jgi:hypothetical protein
MNGPPRQRPRSRRHLEATVADPVLTKTLAARVKREVALEKATEDESGPIDDPDAPVVVVLGPDGIPQIADAGDAAPETVRIDIDDAPPKRRE